jgi:ABC-type dipeptide/oligopeptide/nickel transport system permease subunit
VASTASRVAVTPTDDPAWRTPRSTRGRTRSAWSRFASDRLALLGATIILVVVLVAVFAPLLAPYDYTQQVLTARRAGPSLAHLLGQDELGRDILSRLVFGARATLLAGVLTVLVGGLIGVPLGLLAGFYGGYSEALIMRCIDGMLAFPAFLLAIVIVAVLGPSLVNATLAIGIASIPVYARLVRGTVLSARSEDYVLGARALGADNARIMLRHILPAVLAPVIVTASLSLATAILAVAGLSFLGLGAQPPEPEWGAMLGAGRTYIRDAPHITAAPGVAIMLLVVAFNLVGDGLRDALDPKLERSFS